MSGHIDNSNKPITQDSEVWNLDQLQHPLEEVGQLSASSQRGIVGDSVSPSDLSKPQIPPNAETPVLTPPLQMAPVVNGDIQPNAQQNAPTPDQPPLANTPNPLPTTPVAPQNIPDPNVAVNLSANLNTDTTDDTNVDDSSDPISDASDADFEQLVDQYAQTNGLTRADAQKLKTLYYHPEMTPPPNLAAAFNSLKEQENKAIQAQYGADAVVTPDTDQYDASIRSNYRFLNEQAVAQYAQDNNLSDTALTQLRTVLKDPNAQGIPDNIRAAASAILQGSLKTIQEQYGVDATWTPTGSALWEGSPTRLSALNTINQMQTTLDTLSDQIPYSPDGISLKNFLKEVGKALNQMQENIYAMERNDAEKGRTLSIAKKEMMQAKIDAYKESSDAQKAKQAEIAKKQHKSGIIGAIMKIFNPILIAISAIATIASAGTLGPVAVGVMLSLTALTVASQISGNGALVNWTLGVVGEGLAAFAKAVGGNEDIARFVGKMVMVIAILLICRNPAGLTGPVTASTTALGQSGAFTDLLTGSGVDPDKAAFIGGIISAAIQLVATIGLTASTMANKEQAIARLEDNLAETNRAITNMQAQFIVTGEVNELKMMGMYVKLAYQKLGMAFLQDMRRVVGVTTGLMNVGTGAMTIVNGKFTKDIKGLMADVAIIRSQSDATALMWEQFIQEMTQVIKKLQAILDDLVKALPEISQMQVKKYDSARMDFSLQG